MRNILYFLLGLWLLGALDARAQSGYSAPYYYALYSGTLTVAITGYYGPGGDVNIPTNLDGFTVTGITGDAFLDVNNIKTVTIPFTVTNIASAVFSGCSGLVSISVDPANPAYSSVAGILFDKAQDTLLQFPSAKGGSYLIPSIVTNLSMGAFGNCTNLVNVIIPDSVTSLPTALFESDSELTNVTLPATITNIEDSAFAYCSSLIGITIPNGVIAMGDYTFAKCFSLTNLTIPDSVTSIGNSAFWESGLTSISVPDSVTNVDNYAFWYSGALTNATIGSGVVSIGIEVFSDCPSLQAITVDTNNSAYMSAGGVLFDKDGLTLMQYPIGKPTTSYAVPDSVTTIGLLAFQGCTDLREITLDDNLTNITGSAYGFPGGAFSFCSRLKQIAIPDSVTFIGAEAFDSCVGLSSVSIGNGVDAIEEGTFADCSNLTTLTIGTGVTNIGDGAFYSCGLTSISIPGSVTIIGEQAFAFTSLTNLAVPGSVAWIGPEAFEGCTNLERLTIGEGVTNIDYEAFVGCANLVSATIGSGVTNLGYAAFAECPQLSAVYFEGNAPSADSSVFSEDAVTVYYRPGTTGWPAFAIATGVTVTPWLPQIAVGTDFGILSNQFGFDISAPPNMQFSVQACTNLAHPVWTNLSTITITNGTAHFIEPAQFNVADRFYRLSWP